MLTLLCYLDFDKLQDQLKKRTLEDKVLTASTVDVSNQVKVTGYGANTTDETLTFYFENKRSGGGEVINVRMEDTRTLVQFKNAEGILQTS